MKNYWVLATCTYPCGWSHTEFVLIILAFRRNRVLAFVVTPVGIQQNEQRPIFALSHCNSWKLEPLSPILTVMLNLFTDLWFTYIFRVVLIHLFWKGIVSGIWYRLFHLKCNPNYSSICKLWWHQYNKTDGLFCSLYLLWRTYRTASQLTLNIFMTFLKTSIYLKFYYQLVYCCVAQNFLVRLCTAEWFTNGSRWFWYKVMFENEYILPVNTPFLCLDSFCSTGVSGGLVTRVTLTLV
jgi:hypothetical protein